MPRTPTVPPTGHPQRSPAEPAASRHTHGPSETVPAGPRLPEARRRAALRALEAAIADGLASGPAAPMEPMADLIAEARRAP